MRFIWGKEFMTHNENNNAFHDNQYGGRKGRQPQSAILNKLQAEDAGLLDNDAKACYDRALPYLTAFMLRRLGMPHFLSRFMCVVLKQMEYKIKLSNGMTASYSNNNKDVFGTGQGAGWSPTCWAANSDVISHSMEKYTPGMTLVHPQNGGICRRHKHGCVTGGNIKIQTKRVLASAAATNNASPTSRKRRLLW